MVRNKKKPVNSTYLKRKGCQYIQINLILVSINAKKNTKNKKIPKKSNKNSAFDHFFYIFSMVVSNKSIVI
jgi:hypothetical protein